MSKRENPVVLALVIAAAFILSLAGIWWAQQFGFGLHSSVENKSESTSQSSTPPDKNLVSQEESQTKVAPSSKTANQPLKTAEDLVNWPVEREISFIIDSKEITAEGRKTLNQLVELLKEYDPGSVALRVRPNLDNKSTNNLGNLRGEHVATYIRDRGLKHRVVISQKTTYSLDEKDAAKRPRNPLTIVRLQSL